MNLKDKFENVKNGETILLGGRCYDIYPDTATTVERFYPGYGSTRKYSFIVKDKKNITIDGQGAELIFHGQISPFNFVNCENITLKNFCIDYAVPGYACGKIIDVTDDYFDLDFTFGEFNIDVTEDGSAKIFDDFGVFEVISRCLILSEIDSKTTAHIGAKYFLKLDDWEKTALLASLYRKSKFEMLSKNIIRIYAKRDWSRETKHKVGNYIFFDVSGRNNVNIEFDNCSNLHLENINMYASLGLAIIGINCKNIYANSVNSVIRENSGRITAVKDDVFHLVATKGEVIIENSNFENMLDDAANLHSFYPTIREVVDPHTVVIEIICPQKKMLDFYRNNQRLKLLKNDYTDTGKYYTICGHSYVSDKLIKLEFKEELSSDVVGFLFDDSEGAADFTFRNCKVANTHGRVVVQTPGKSVVEDCYFHTKGSSIIVNGRSKTYSESAPITDLTIKNNVFDNYGTVSAISTAPGCYNPENKIIYGKISIENNKFISNGNKCMVLKYFDEVTIRKNTFEQNHLCCKKDESQTPKVVINFCNKVIAE